MARPRSRLRARRALMVAGGLVAVVAIILAALIWRHGGAPTVAPSAPPGPSSSPSSPSGQSGAVGGVLLRIDPATNQVAAQTHAVGDDPVAVAVGEGSVWVADAASRSILRLDPTTGEVVATITLGEQPRHLAIGGGIRGVWINTVNHAWKIDPASNRVVLSRDVADATGAIAVGEGSVWVTGLVSSLDRIDPANGRVHRGFAGSILCSACYTQSNGYFTGDHQRGAPPSVAAGLGFVWAVAFPPPTGTASVWRIDPVTGSSTPIPVPFSPVSVAVGEGAVWAAGTHGEVARIDPETNAVQVIQIGDGAAQARGQDQVAVGLGAVWVLDPTRGIVIRVDPRTSAVVATIDVGAGTKALAVGEGSVWVTRVGGS